METIYKILENCEVKKVGERQYEFIASTADMDRDGEVIDVAGWDLKNFKKNPVIMFGHDYRSLPIGKATKIGVKDGKLMNVVEFPPEGTYEFADTVQRLVDAGYLKTESVGFIPKKWEDAEFEDEKSNKPRRTYTKQELLEISIVPVPSNPNALMNAVKEGVITQKQFNSITSKNLIDDIVNAPIVDLTEEDKITKPEETDDFIRIPVRTCEATATIDISKKEGISALYCGKEKQVRTYLFRKDKGWTMAKAKAWVKEHEGKSILISTTTNSENDDEVIGAYIQTDDIIFNSPRSSQTSQSEIIDEIDYLKSLIAKEGLSDEGKELFEELMRASGYDKPVHIENRDDLSQPLNRTLTNQDILESIKRIGGIKSC